MLSKNRILVYISLIMFSFFGKVEAKYDKIFFDLSIKDINGEDINMKQYNGKTILLVNVASNCGFTKQYDGLQELYEKYKNEGLVVIGIPSNQFGGQEPGSNQEIKDFCENNFNITFPIMNKVNVKGEKAHSVYLWAKGNFGTSTIPKWNFHKILINKHGKIEDTYGSFVKPMSKKIISRIESIL